MDVVRRRRRRATLGRNLDRVRATRRMQAIDPPPLPLQSPKDDHEGQQTLRVNDLQREIRTLRRLQSVIHFLATAMDDRTLQAQILDLAHFVSRLKRGMLALPVRESDGVIRFRVKLTRGFDKKTYASSETALLHTLLDDSLRSRESVFQGSVLEGGILGHTPRPEMLRLGAVVCLPLIVQGSLLGALVLDDPKRSRPFASAEESVLHSFARHAALALARLRDHRRQKRERATQEATIRESSGRHLALSLVEESSYSEAKEFFTRHYLTQALRRAAGDLRTTSMITGLPIARLVGLLDHLGIDLSVLEE